MSKTNDKKTGASSSIGIDFLIEKLRGRLIEKLRGRWKVKACGLAAPMNLLGDEKLIDGREGRNLIHGVEWGWFRVEGGGEPLNLILNYDDPRNPKWMRGIRDEIKKYGNDWIGHLFYDGKMVFAFKLLPTSRSPLEQQPFSRGPE